MISRNGKIVIFTKSSGPNKAITQFSIPFSSSLFMLFCFLEWKAKFENLNLGLAKVVPKFSLLPQNNSILLLAIYFPPEMLTWFWDNTIGDPVLTHPSTILHAVFSSWTSWDCVIAYRTWLHTVSLLFWPFFSPHEFLCSAYLGIVNPRLAKEGLNLPLIYPYKSTNKPL